MPHQLLSEIISIDFIENIDLKYKGVFEYMPKKYSVNWINQEEKFKETLSSTEAIKDLYFPNDSHWGYYDYHLCREITLTQILDLDMKQFLHELH